MSFIDEPLYIAAVAVVGFLIGAIWGLVAHGTRRTGLMEAASVCRHAAGHPTTPALHPTTICIELAEAIEEEARL